MRDKQDQPAESHPDTVWPLALALIVAAVGFGVVAFGHWRQGAITIGAATILAALLRLVLPVRIAGLLVVRRRWVDVGGLLALGLAIIVVASQVPRGF